MTRVDSATGGTDLEIQLLTVYSGQLTLYTSRFGGGGHGRKRENQSETYVLGHVVWFEEYAGDTDTIHRAAADFEGSNHEDERWSGNCSRRMPTGTVTVIYCLLEHEPPVSAHEC